MSDSIVRLKVESQEYDAKLKRAAEGLQRYADQCRKVGGTLEVVEQETLDYVRALGQMETHSRTATGKLAEMKKAFVEFSAVYRDMTEQEKQSPMGKALSESLDQLKGRINDSKKQLAEINAEIGETGKTGEKTDMSLKGLADAFGLNITKLTTIGGALAMAKGAFSVFTDAMMSSREVADNFGRDIQGLENVYQSFLVSLNNSDISGFLSRIQEIVGAARKAYDAVSELQEFNAFNRVNVQNARTGLNNAITDYRGGNATKEQVQQANEILKKELHERSIREQAAYEETIGQIAARYNTNADDLKALLSKDYTAWNNQKHSNLQGSGTAWSSMPFGTMAGSWSGQSPVFSRNVAATSDEHLSILARSIPLETLDKLQQMGEQAAATETEISALDKSLSRLLNKKDAALGGGGRGGSGGGSSNTVKTEMQTLQESIKELEQEYIKLGGITAEDANKRRSEIQAEIQANETRINQIRLLNEQAHGRLLGGTGVSTEGVEGGKFAFDAEALQENLDYVLEQIKVKPIVIPLETTKDNIEGITKAAQNTAKVVGTIGMAFNAIEDPAAKVAAIVAQAIANVALAYSDALAKTTAEKFNIWGFIAASAAAMVSMGTSIAAIHQATGYERGGVVKGGGKSNFAEGGIIYGMSYSGDKIGGVVDNSQLVGLNAGELVLTKAQQGSLAQQLNGQGVQTVRVVGKLSGKDLFICAENWAKSAGKGEFVTW